MSRQNGPALLSRTTLAILNVLYVQKGPLRDTEIPILAQVPFGDVLSALGRLQRHHWVHLTTITDPADEDGDVRRRRLYTLTPEGRTWAETALGKDTT